eukprot:12489837-Alexandrium_andersonii.AAC.1
MIIADSALQLRASQSDARERASEAMPSENVAREHCVICLHPPFNHHNGLEAQNAKPGKTRQTFQGGTSSKLVHNVAQAPSRVQKQDRKSVMQSGHGSNIVLGATLLGCTLGVRR